MSDPVKKLQILVLGERDYPLAPMINVKDDITGALEGLHAQAMAALPDATYDDTLKLVLRLGMKQLPAIFAAGGRVERHGRVSFAPTREGREAHRLEAARADLLSLGILDETLVLADRAPVPQPDPPKNTIPVPAHAPTPPGQPAV